MLCMNAPQGRKCLCFKNNFLVFFYVHHCMFFSSSLNWFISVASYFTGLRSFKPASYILAATIAYENIFFLFYFFFKLTHSISYPLFCFCYLILIKISSRKCMPIDDFKIKP